MPIEIKQEKLNRWEFGFNFIDNYNHEQKEV